jgi:hypothetical protein
VKKSLSLPEATIKMWNRLTCEINKPERGEPGAPKWSRSQVLEAAILNYGVPLLVAEFPDVVARIYLDSGDDEDFRELLALAYRQATGGDLAAAAPALAGRAGGS